MQVPRPREMLRRAVLGVYICACAFCEPSVSLLVFVIVVILICFPSEIPQPSLVPPVVFPVIPSREESIPPSSLLSPSTKRRFAPRVPSPLRQSSSSPPRSSVSPCTFQCGQAGFGLSPPTHRGSP
eukprot:m.232832 g.232832  ORF g.232832 m.232832 type:complete len:126 (-) comp54282_c1_seq9:318-695(-)